MSTIKESHKCECGADIEVEMDEAQTDTLFKCKSCGKYFVGYVGIDSDTDEMYLSTVAIEGRAVNKLIKDPNIIKAT